jgi:transposase InsO family protein
VLIPHGVPEVRPTEAKRKRAGGAKLERDAQVAIGKAEIFDTLLEARVVVEIRSKEYNTVRSHGSLGYRPPAPEAIEV